MKTRFTSYFSLSAFLAAASVSGAAAAQAAQGDDTVAPLPPPAPPAPAATTDAGPPEPAVAAPAEPPAPPTPSAPPPSSSSEPPPVVTLGPTEPVKKDEPQAASTADSDKKERKLPFRNSTLLFDQTVSTQTAHVETSPQQSYTPFYEWWISFRPRYYFTDKLRAQFRFDYYKEFTNSEQTTKYRADVFGDIWSDLIYATPVPAISKNLKVSAGVRALWPTSKESQANGLYFTGGLTSAATYTIPIKGESAKFLNEAHITTSFAYSHPFSRATSPVDTSFTYTRQDAEGHSISSNQLRGGTLTNHQFLAILDTGLAITPKMSLTLDMILINKWRHAPTADQTIAVTGGSAFIPRSPNTTLHTVDTWFIASVDYQLFDEMTLGLGYMNLQSELSPTAQRRGIFTADNIWWSPDARIFFDITANLDKIYERIAGTKDNKPEAPKPPVARAASRLNAF